MITIYDALATKLGRTPTHAETIAEVKRILREIAEAEGMTDAEASAMEDALRRNGRFYFTASRCAFPA